MHRGVSLTRHGSKRPSQIGRFGSRSIPLFCLPLPNSRGGTLAAESAQLLQAIEEQRAAADISILDLLSEVIPGNPLFDEEHVKAELGEIAQKFCEENPGIKNMEISKRRTWQRHLRIKAEAELKAKRDAVAGVALTPAPTKTCVNCNFPNPSARHRLPLPRKRKRRSSTIFACRVLFVAAFDRQTLGNGSPAAEVVETKILRRLKTTIKGHGSWAIPTALLATSSTPGTARPCQKKVGL